MRNLYPEIAVPLLLATVFGLFSSASGQNCVIPLEPTPKRNLPLYVSPNRGALYPVNSRAIVVLPGETVFIECTGQGNTLVGLPYASISATCQPQGLVFGNMVINYALNCTEKISDAVRDMGLPCGPLGNSMMIQIGWELSNNKFLVQEMVCFNQGDLSTEYTLHILHGSGMRYQDRGTLSRPSFKLDSYFSHLNPSMANVYHDQDKTVAALLQSTTLANAYIRGWGPESYLVRGHLSPDKDFVLQTWQDATYHYINVVPMWQAFNNGNWKGLEDYIRTVAAKPTPKELSIYTGTYGFLKLPDVNGNDVIITLWNGQQNRGVPVPEHVWKVVHDPQNNKAVAFIMLNHPNNPQYPILEPPLLCPDVCIQITWVKWPDRNNKNKGKIYCCTVDELAKTIPNIPNPPNVGLMT